MTRPRGTGRSQFVLVSAALLIAITSLSPASGVRAVDEPPGDTPDQAAFPHIPHQLPPVAGEASADRVIVRFRDSASPQARQNARSAEQLERIRGLESIGAEVVRVRGRSAQAAVTALSRRPDVEYAQLDFRLAATVDYEDEPLFEHLWGLDNDGQFVDGARGTRDVDINARQASAVAPATSPVIVAVIDDGVDFQHRDLTDRRWTNVNELPNGLDDDGNGLVDDISGWDFCHGDASVHDFNDDWHGTHVAGTIAASLNGYGVVGVAPNVRIMALKFLGDSCYGWTSDAISAIEYAADNGAQIINASWGGPGNDPALERAIEASGMLFVTSAGNAGANNDTASTGRSYPAAYDSPNLVAVAALNPSGQLASFSNYGPTTVDIGAPGVSILSAFPASSQGPAGWAYSDGTSMASPHVAGAAALIASVYPALADDPIALRQRLLDTGKPARFTSGKTVTGRMLDVGRAVGADVTGPTGSVSINLGAPDSYGPTVDLALSASDVPSGVTLMRISNSGQLDGPELVFGRTQAYGPTTRWSLTDAAYGGTTSTGTKTVHVQFADGMGNWSAVRTDTIKYVVDAPATCSSAAPLRALNSWPNETIFPAGDSDTFRFQTTSSQNALVTLGRPAADYRLDLYNSSCALLATSNLGGAAFEQIYRQLPAGTYYVRVSATQAGTESLRTYAVRFQSLSNTVHLLSTGSAWKDSTGKVHIPGEVLNATQQHRTIRATATLYNSANTAIGSVSVTTFRSVVPSRWRSPFEIVFTPPAGYHHFQVAVTSVTSSTAGISGLSVTGSAPYVDGSGARHHPGTVKNTNTFSVRSVQVFTTLYDAFGNVVNVGRMTPNLAAGGGWLAPGASASYDVVVKPHAGVNRDSVGVQAIR